MLPEQGCDAVATPGKGMYTRFWQSCGEEVRLAYLALGMPFVRRFGECELDEMAECVLKHARRRVSLVREAAVPP